MKKQAILLSPLASILVVLSGCGGDKIVPVSGQIKLDGKPLEGVKVSFNPVAAKGESEAGPASYGETDGYGRYELRLITDDSMGAWVGKHRVVLSAQTADGDAGTVPDKVPPHERNQEFEVPEGGTDSADFSLTSKPPSDDQTRS